MLHPAAPMGECLFAKRTPVPLYDSVNVLLMVVAVLRRPKSHAAKPALERPLPGVRALVIIDVRLFLKTLFTITALEAGHLVLVPPVPVQLQMLHGLESCAAFIALEGTTLDMDGAVVE